MKWLMNTRRNTWLVAVFLLVAVGFWQAIPAYSQSGPPELSVPSNISAEFGEDVVVPLSYVSNGNDIASTAFSVDYDHTCLAFDTTDTNLDGIPDSIELSIPAAFNFVSVSFSSGDTDGEIDLLLADAASPLSSLPDGTIAEITLTTTCTPDPGQSIVAPIAFSSEPPASFSDTFGQNVAGTVTDGSIQIDSTIAAPEPVPGVSTWGLIALSLALVAMMVWRLTRASQGGAPA